MPRFTISITQGLCIMPPRKRPTGRHLGALLEAKQSSRGPSARMHFEPFLHYLEAECGMSPNTIKSYQSDLQQFLGLGPTAGHDASQEHRSQVSVELPAAPL